MENTRLPFIFPQCFKDTTPLLSGTYCCCQDASSQTSAILNGVNHSYHSYKLFYLSLIFCRFYNVSIGQVYFCLSCSGLSSELNYVFCQYWNILIQYLLKYCFFGIYLSFSSKSPIRYTLQPLNVSHPSSYSFRLSLCYTQYYRPN